MPDVVGVLDGLVARVLSAYPYRFTVAATPAERATAYRIRFGAVVAEGWAPAGAFPDGLEHDEYDDAAVHVVGWDGDNPVSAGRLVLPPGPLPTEQSCGLTVEPRGRVVDVGRMSVVPSYQTHRHAAFIALLCRLYLEMRASGYEVACGMMSPRVRGLLRQLGLQLEVLAPDRVYWGEPRAPVRFALTVNALSLGDRWSAPEVTGSAEG
ncbi:MAG: hypothetical protein ACXV2J_10665 [Actinomycetes bacterium]